MDVKLRERIDDSGTVFFSVCEALNINALCTPEFSKKEDLFNYLVDPKNVVKYELISFLGVKVWASKPWSRYCALSLVYNPRGISKL